MIPLASFSGIENLKRDIIIEKWTFIQKFLESLLLGFQHEEIKVFSEELTSSYCECIHFFVIKRLMPIIVREEEFKLKILARDLFTKSTMNFVQQYIQNYDKSKPMNNYRSVPDCLARIFNKFEIE